MNREEDILAKIWASIVTGNNRKLMKTLIYIYGDILNAYRECEKGKCFTGIGVDNKAVEKLRDKAIFKKANEILLKCAENDIQVLILDSNKYPENLKELYNPPSLLYCKGFLASNINKICNTSISIVGARKCTSYGRMISFNFAKELSKYNITIVSGMARGIDSEAHKGALWGNGNTIAILGCGVDVVYPKENVKLYNEILERGCILSEYPPGTPPLKNHFPARNRIISGISKGVLIVEAAKKSGAMITVDMALEQGKNVYVIPGNINSDASVGCNELIKNGASCVTGIYDILDEFDIKYDDIYNTTLKYNLSESEIKIYNAILKGFNSANSISNELKIDISSILTTLTMLEIKGILLKDFDGLYKVII